jgi:uncharacterized protein YjbI with pentapeptide repeats
MMHPGSPNFANQDLRNRSFRGQVLNYADFSGSDLRGCDFSRASLVGATFDRARLGASGRQWATLGTIALVTALLMGHAVSQMVFGAMGQTPAEPAWNYVVALYISLGIAGTIGFVPLKPPSIRKLLQLLAATASGALLGFFYGGSTTGDNPQVAVAAALAGGLAANFSLRWRAGRMALTIAAAVAAYGFAFLMGTTALAYLAALRPLAGFSLSLLTLIYLWLTLKAFVLASAEIRQFPGTSFRAADLTHASFANVDLKHADFKGGIGLE